MRRVHDSAVAAVAALPGKPAGSGEKAKSAHREEALATSHKDVTDAQAELQEAKRMLEVADATKPTVDARSQGSATPRNAKRPTDVKRLKSASAGSSTDAAAIAPDLAKSRAEAETKVAEAGSKLYVAEKKEAALGTAAEAAEVAATHTALLRETRARVLWFGTFDLSLVVALGTVCAMVWAWITALDDHLRPAGLACPRTIGEWAEAVGKLIGVVVCSAAVPLGIWYAASKVVGAWIFGDFRLPSPFDFGGLLAFDDSFQSFLFGSDIKSPVQPGTLLQHGLPLVRALNLAVILAGIAIAAAVTATLYQHPEQVESRQQNRTASTTADDYVHFLARCFQRLSVAIYFGAVLLVVCVTHVSAQYSWPAALLEPGATDEPTKTDLPKALNALTDQFALEYGTIFSLVLIGLFLPTWVVLRRRAWQVVRTRKASKTRADQQKWLESQGLGFTSIQHVAQVLAVLAPAGAGTFIAILKTFSGG
jgi:hypothetical protein